VGRPAPDRERRAAARGGRYHPPASGAAHRAAPERGAPAPERARPGLAPARRVCACCSSPLRAEIGQRLAAGQSAKAIEAILAPAGPSDESIRHHARHCIPRLLGERGEELRAEILTTVRGRAERLLKRAEKLIDDAETSGVCEACGATTQAAPPRDRAATINACNNVLVILRWLPSAPRREARR
jgi:hypothetical protein